MPAARRWALALILAACAWTPLQATTFYVRVDGGDAVQCTGRTNAAYPGNGTGRPCAWRHPFYALPPTGARRMLGGDTLLIGSGSYMIGPGAPGAGACSPANCGLAPIPSGHAGMPTRILSTTPTTIPPRLWGTAGVTRILSLEGSAHVELGQLEITDQDNCVHEHSNPIARCPAVGSGAWARYGLYARASSNVWLHDLDIHGLAHSGMWAGGLDNWTVERVRLLRNGRAGWDANIGTGSGNTGTIILRRVEFAWNGCGERWQSSGVWACWGQTSGGYGDGLGTTTTGGNWLIEDTFAHHNTQDGLDLRFLDGADTTHATLRRVRAVGNAGNQVKVRGNALVENSLLVGNCGYFNRQYLMLPADICRSDGSTLLLVLTPNDSIVVRHSTIVGEGVALVGTTEGDATGRVWLQNNVMVGFPYFLRPAERSRVRDGTSPAIVSYAGNLVWTVQSNACPPMSICNQNPRLTNMSLGKFDARPLTGSPVVDRVAPSPDVITDYLRNIRPMGAASDIGAYELKGTLVCHHFAPVVNLAGPTASVPAGTAVAYTVTVTNRDNGACAATRFHLGSSVPAGWTGRFGVASLVLGPGASGSATYTVTSATNATAGSRAVGVRVSSSAAGAVHSSSATIAHTVGTPGSPCARAAPLLTLTGPLVPVQAGTDVTYTLNVTNADNTGCGITTFSLARIVPAGWTGTLGTSTMALAAGVRASTSLRVTSPMGAANGTYLVGASTLSSAGAVHVAIVRTPYNIGGALPPGIPAGQKTPLPLPLPVRMTQPPP